MSIHLLLSKSLSLSLRIDICFVVWELQDSSFKAAILSLISWPQTKTDRRNLNRPAVLTLAAQQHTIGRRQQGDGLAEDRQ